MFRIRFSLPDQSQVEVEGQTPGEALAAKEAIVEANKFMTTPGGMPDIKAPPASQWRQFQSSEAKARLRRRSGGAD